jgi:hypothetical protein
VPGGTSPPRCRSCRFPTAPSTSRSARHYLFLYSAQLGVDAHVAAIREMCRVAREARVFPLLALGSRPSPHVEPVRAALAAAGLVATIEPVPYEFQRGGDRMLRVVSARGRRRSSGR